MSKVPASSPFSSRFERQMLTYARTTADNTGKTPSKVGEIDPGPIQDAERTKVEERLDKDLQGVNLAHDKVVALDAFVSKVQDLEKITKKIINPGGISTKDIFKTRIASITTTETSQDASSFLKASAKLGAALEEYKISVNRMALSATKSIFSSVDAADNHYIGFPSQTSDIVTGAAGYFTAGTFDITSILGTQTITLVGGDSLQTIKVKINSISTSTGVIASTTRTTDGYILSLKATTTGVANDFTITDSGALVATQREGTVAVPGVVRHVDITQAGGVGFAARNTDVVTGTAGNFTAGTFTLNGVGIVLTSGDSLNTIVQTINAQVGTTGVIASIKSVAGVYHLILDLKDNTADRITITALPTDVFTPGGILRTNYNAQDASITLNDIAECTSSTNVISDLVDGDDITLTLIKVNTPGNSQTLVVQENKDAILRDGVDGFLDTYNALALFLAQQTERDPSSKCYKETALLSSNITLNNVAGYMCNVVMPVAGLPSGTCALAHIGIERQLIPEDKDKGLPEYYGLCVADASLLNSVIAENFDLIRQIFTTTLTSNYTNLECINSTSQTTISKFTLDISAPAGGTRTATITPFGGGAIAVTYEGNEDSGVVIGTVGTATEGLKIYYIKSSNLAESFNNVVFSRGIASRLYDQISPLVTSSSGNALLKRDYAEAQKQEENAKSQATKQQKALDALIEKQRETNAKIQEQKAKSAIIANYLDTLTGKGRK
ncbi:MAG: flagellin hook IN motif-containing protein [Pseudomonadota bacterium]